MFSIIMVCRFFIVCHTSIFRNLSFDRTNEGLEEHFIQYGDINYSKVVIDPQTEHSKGLKLYMSLFYVCFFFLFCDIKLIIHPKQSLGQCL